MTRKLTALLLTLTLLLCTSCTAMQPQEPAPTPQPTTFSKSGMTITLTDDFAEKEYVTYTAVYDSAEIAVFALKEEFWLFDSSVLSAESSVADYADLVWKSNSFSGDVPVSEQDGLTWFDYDRTVNGGDYTYRTYVFKGSDSFWFVQFAAFTDNFSNVESTIHAFAKSVTVE